MNHWLLKTEPGEYSWDDLVHDKKTVWSGIANPTAFIHLRKVKKGDAALIYHTGSERTAVGIGQIESDPYPDPTDDDPRHVVVDLTPRAKLARPVTLNEIKADKIFSGWDLLRISRLSVVPVPTAMWKRIEQLARRPAPFRRNEIT